MRKGATGGQLAASAAPDQEHLAGDSRNAVVIFGARICAKNETILECGDQVDAEGLKAALMTFGPKYEDGWEVAWDCNP